MKHLHLDLTITLNQPMEFSYWLPTNRENWLGVDVDGMTIKLSFLLADAGWETIPTQDEVQRTLNNALRAFRVGVSLDVDDYTAATMANGNGSGTVKTQYKELGLRIQSAVVRVANRFIAYVRAEVGQHAISELRPDNANPSQFFLQHKTRATLDGKPLRFDPDNGTINLTVVMPNANQMITKERWDAIRVHVEGKDSTPLVSTLIANAMALAEQGNRRSALVEGATALEVALHEFGRHPAEHITQRLAPQVSERLEGIVSRLGFRGTLDILLPLIFTEAEFPRSVLAACRDGIDQRNNVVHNGQRDVTDARIAGFLKAFLAACGILRQATQT